MTAKTIATIGGDGIGPEVVDASIDAITAAAAIDQIRINWEHLPHGATHFLETNETLAEGVFEHLRDDTDAILVGALDVPRPTYDPSVFSRKITTFSFSGLFTGAATPLNQRTGRTQVYKSSF